MQHQTKIHPTMKQYFPFNCAGFTFYNVLKLIIKWLMLSPELLFDLIYEFCKISDQNSQYILTGRNKLCTQALSFTGSMPDNICAKFALN